MYNQTVSFSMKEGKINKSYKLIQNRSFMGRGSKLHVFSFFISKFIRECRNLLFRNSSVGNMRIVIKQPALFRLINKFNTKDTG